MDKEPEVYELRMKLNGSPTDGFRRYLICNAQTLENLRSLVAMFIDEKPVYEPTGGPFYADGKWKQAIFWKE